MWRAEVNNVGKERISVLKRSWKSPFGNAGGVGLQNDPAFVVDNMEFKAGYKLIPQVTSRLISPDQRWSSRPPWQPAPLPGSSDPATFSDETLRDESRS